MTLFWVLAAQVAFIDSGLAFDKGDRKWAWFALSVGIVCVVNALRSPSKKGTPR